jgi:hypothetical protein
MAEHARRINPHVRPHSCRLRLARRGGGRSRGRFRRRGQPCRPRCGYDRHEGRHRFGTRRTGIAAHTVGRSRGYPRHGLAETGYRPEWRVGPGRNRTLGLRRLASSEGGAWRRTLRRPPAHGGRRIGQYARTVGDPGQGQCQDRLADRPDDARPDNPQGPAGRLAQRSPFHRMVGTYDHRPGRRRSRPGPCRQRRTGERPVRSRWRRVRQPGWQTRGAETVRQRAAGIGQPRRRHLDRPGRQPAEWRTPARSVVRRVARASRAAVADRTLAERRALRAALAPDRSGRLATGG